MARMTYSAGIIPYRFNNNGDVEFFVGHPGGPFWHDKDYWALLKGRRNKDESAESCAIREFQEESGITLTDNEKSKIWYLGFVKQRKDKIVSAFALEKPDINPDVCYSNMADNCEWPEIDKYAWMELNEVVAKTHPTNIFFFQHIAECSR